MASRSSQPKNASRVTHEHANALLEDGARIEEPTDDVIAAAERLRVEGLIDFSLREYVKCVEPRDVDFPPRNRHCQGRIVMHDGMDEDGDEVRCPQCERPVRAVRFNKLRHKLLEVSVRQLGALTWLRSQLERISTNVVDLGNGAFHVGGFGSVGVTVCVADLDGPADSKYNARDYAATNPVCYVTINPKVPEGRFLKDGCVCRAALVDLVAGVVDLRALLTRLVETSPPTSLSKVDVPVYAKGHVLIQPVAAPHPQRVFYVEVCNDVLRVNDEVVVNPQGKARLALFRILLKQFIDDMTLGLSPEDFTAINIRQLCRLMKKAQYPQSDETAMRRMINNLQSDIETAVKRGLGLPIDREDIVQTCRMTSQADTSGGYRINPFSVAIRPSQKR